MFGSIFKTVSGVAKQSLGSVTQARSILSMNPLAAGLVFPPQVSLGLKAASTIGGFVGLKVPTESELIGMATGQVDKLLGGIRSPISRSLDQLEGSLKSVDSAIAGITNNETINKLKGLPTEEVLNSIDWLL